MEFPRVDERLVGRPHRWGYASQIGRADLDNDFAAGTTSCGSTPRAATPPGSTSATGRFGGEWVMVPRHADAAEDDGWLLSLVYDAGTDRSELVVLPAADPADGPVARVLLPNRVPAGFHGNWVAD